MLIIRRAAGESFYIGEGEEIEVFYLGRVEGEAKIGIRAPENVRIVRKEVLRKRGTQETEEPGNAS